MSKNDKQIDDSKLQKQKVDLIVIGNQNSGKTSLIKRFVQGQKAFSHFYNPTLGINLQKRDIKLDNKLISVNIWDTAGQEKFLAITKNYFRKADGVLVIFDLTDKNSFQSTCVGMVEVSKFWIHQVKEKAAEETLQIIIGNKVDMEKERVVKFQEGQRLSQELKLAYFQTSAKTGQNVEQAINFIVKQCLKKIKQQEGGGVVLNGNGNDKKTSCFGGVKEYLSGFFKKKQKKQQIN